MAKSDVNTSEAQKKLTKSLNILYGKAKKYREGEVKSDWKNSLEWFKGNQSLASPAQSLPTAISGPPTEADSQTNLIFSALMTIVPFLANRSPNVVLKPIVSTLDRHASEISECINRVFHRNDVIDRQGEMVTNGLLFGKGYWKTTWNDDLNMGKGDIEIRTRDTRYIFLEPGKMTVKESNYLFDSSRVDKLTMYRMYPDKIAQINSAFMKDESHESRGGEFGESSGVGYHAAAPGEAALTTSEAYMVESTQLEHESKEHVDLVEVWFHDERMVDVTENLVEYGEVKKVRTGEQEAMYPNGRLVVFSGDVIFEDRPNPFPRFPYVEFENYFVPGEPYSMTEVKQLLNLQLQYNVRSNQLMDAIAHGIHRLTYYDSTSGLRPDEITNEPGQFVPVSNIGGIKEADPPGVPSAAFVSLQAIKQDFDRISGIEEVVRGSSPGDVRSGYAIEQLQESAANRMKLKTRSLEAAIREESRLITEFIAIFYEKGVHYHDDTDLQGVKPEGFEYHVKAGINLPRSSTSEQQHAQWMFANNIVDEKYIIENSNIANKQELLDRMKPIWEAMKQQQMGVDPNVTPMPQTGGA